MSEPLTIVIQGAPVGKGRPRFGSGRTYTPVATRNYEAGIALLAKAEMRGRQLLDGPLHLDVRAVFAIPRSWPAGKRALALTGDLRPTIKPDADNIIKVIADGLNGIAYRDDAQLVSGSFAKVYGVEPFVVATIKSVLEGQSQQKEEVA